MNRCNGADLRIVVVGGDLALAVSEIRLTHTTNSDAHNEQYVFDFACGGDTVNLTSITPRTLVAVEY